MKCVNPVERESPSGKIKEERNCRVRVRIRAVIGSGETAVDVFNRRVA
jgi:hypothetical protein